ncbi:helix-turn-helix domain-containing protein [Kitasatospora viridis]|uniref:Sugar-specific transcriptional regulator TrmB n=1 Tax=Kitasatospora viridis TaxID=281105 RepID=A0A561SEG0_9ACTN|nr:helix-turn-helix domain-containing protein [Kitasatospora viridis]TWF73227.1 sugar-specific transcriptional regulator TrmB [Kitasatospora viridis]
MPDAHAADRPAALLAPVGLGAVESALYLAVLAAPRATATELARAVGATPARVRGCLRRLLEAGLVTRLAGTPARYTAAPPDAAIGALVTGRQHDLERFRARAHELTAHLRSTQSAGPNAQFAEVIEGPALIRHRVEQMQLGAQREMKVVDCPPYFDNPVANPIEFQLLRRGVACQVIYDASGLESRPRLEFTAACIAAGEQARTLPSVRMKMLIADQQEAMIPLGFGTAEPTTALFVRPSPLLTVLLTCFDLLWERAAPITATGTAPELLDRRDLELLTMLAGGAKDAAIIRALGITQRTLTRRVGRLLTLLDARTRFQAGLQASRRGWL